MMKGIRCDMFDFENSFKSFFRLIIFYIICIAVLVILPSHVSGNDELKCLAKNIYFEARSEKLISQLAVAQVTLNRVRSSCYAYTICEVVWEPRQFSWTHDGKSDIPHNKLAYTTALIIAKIAVFKNPPDVVGFSTHYHHKKIQPVWSDDLTPITAIGSHIYYIEERCL